MIYAYVTLKISHPESLAAYRERSTAALAAHGGAVVAAQKNPRVLEGTDTAPDMGVILSFPDRSAAQAWFDDPALASIHALRRGVGESTIVLLA